MLSSRQVRVANFVVGGSGAGYLKKCSHCQRQIFMSQDRKGKWKPFNSWAAGDAAVGQWRPHICPFR
jgi:hypothetical protein